MRAFFKHLFPNGPTTRFAPSPTGYLHLGHVLSMIYVFGLAEYLDGRVLLRIEDHDRQRCRPEYSTALLEDMEWLGFIPDNWQALNSRHPLLWQSLSKSRYEAHLQALHIQGVIYRCTCSRKNSMLRYLALHEHEAYYGGYCRSRAVSADKMHSMRLIINESTVAFKDIWHGTCLHAPHKQCGDMILVDRHGNPTYNFAVVCDDIDQDIDLIIRGVDLLPCTGRQLYLGKLLNWQGPLFFAHHPLLCDPQGRKLGKRFFSQSLADRRKEGLTGAGAIGEALYLAGLQEACSPVPRSLVPELIAQKVEQGILQLK